MPVKDIAGLTMLAEDEAIRPNATIDAMAKLEPSFAMMGQMGFDATALRKYTTVEKIHHVHHAGNSSGIVDGAALMLLGSKEAGDKAGLRPRARIRSMAVTGSEPTIMLTGPTPACQKALNKLGMTAGDIDLWEINEAFATVPMKTAKDLGISYGYLLHVLKSHGASFSKILWSSRLDQARSWLSAEGMGHLSIQQVAYMAGFKSPAHFSRLFKSATGLSPGDFRQARAGAARNG